VGPQLARHFFPDLSRAFDALRIDSIERETRGLETLVVTGDAVSCRGVRGSMALRLPVRLSGWQESRPVSGGMP
jgi:hypothetical protein